MSLLVHEICTWVTFYGTVILSILNRLRLFGLRRRSFYVPWTDKHAVRTAFFVQKMGTVSLHSIPSITHFQAGKWKKRKYKQMNYS